MLTLTITRATKIKQQIDYNNPSLTNDNERSFIFIAKKPAKHNS